MPGAAEKALGVTFHNLPPAVAWLPAGAALPRPASPSTRTFIPTAQVMWHQEGATAPLEVVLALWVCKLHITKCPGSVCAPVWGKQHPGDPPRPPGDSEPPHTQVRAGAFGLRPRKEEPELQLSREGEKCGSIQLVHSILKMFQMSAAGLHGPPAGSWLGGVTAAAFQVGLSQARFGSGSPAPSGPGPWSWVWPSLT